MIFSDVKKDNDQRLDMTTRNLSIKLQQRGYDI